MWLCPASDSRTTQSKKNWSCFFPESALPPPAVPASRACPEKLTLVGIWFFPYLYPLKPLLTEFSYVTSYFHFPPLFYIKKRSISPQVQTSYQNSEGRQQTPHGWHPLLTLCTHTDPHTFPSGKGSGGQSYNTRDLERANFAFSTTTLE